MNVDKMTELTLRGDRCQCPSCHEYFNSTSAFDKHRVGDFMPNNKHPSPYGMRRCLTVAEMLQHGMVKNRMGFWIGSPMSKDALSSRTE